MTKKKISTSNYNIAIFHLQGYFDSVPCLVSTVKSLSAKGFRVDLFLVRDNQYNSPKFNSSNVRIHYLPGKPGYGINQIFRLLTDRLFISYRICRRNKYLCFFGVDPLGLIQASLVGKLIKVPIVYYSLEIYFSNEIGFSLGYLLKVVERWFNRKAVFTITQDRDRAKLLAQENKVSMLTIFSVPNSLIGEPCISKSDYLQSHLRLEKDQIIILHAGGMASWLMPLELAQAAQYWPKNWLLVFHSRRKNLQGILKKQFANLIKDRRFLLSSEPLHAEDVRKLFGSADIGIALYKNEHSPALGKNISYVGLSSGKISNYLQQGVPIIASAMPSLVKLINRYDCGICVKHPCEIEEGIKKILSSYKVFQKNAIKCYQECFDFDSSFSLVLDKLEKLKHELKM